jgi:hypothetical protein
MNALTDTFVVEATARIRTRMARTAQDIVEIGRDLDMVKRRLGHGKFFEWIEAEFGMSRHSAERFMNVFNTFGGKTRTVRDLQPSVLYALAAPTTPEAVRTEAVAMAKAGKPVTSKIVADLKAKLRDVTAERRQSAEFNRQLSQDLRIVQNERDAANNEVARLRDEIARARAKANDPEFVGTITALFRALWSIAPDVALDQMRAMVTAQSLRVISGKAE